MSSQNRFTVISTFSGCGGSSLGYNLAGGKVLLAVEMDDNAVETYKLNFPDTAIYHGDIHNLTTEKVLEITGLKPGELDILDGSPPCQGFSTAGKREFCDPRNQLYNEYVRLLRGLQPKCFVMENVSGLVKGKMKIIFKDILTELKQSGYNVKVRLMNAKYYNVPQSRQRLIFIGVREDLGIIPTHPKPESKPIILKKVIENVENEEWELDDSINKAKKSSIYPIIKQMKQWEDGSKYKTNSYFNLKRLSYYHPSRTVTKVPGLIHPIFNRYMTITELKRIGSYPNDFRFIGKFDEQWARIGNSVPPNMMKAIATHINKTILSELT